MPDTDDDSEVLTLKDDERYSRKDWAPLRELAQKRAYVRMRKAWEDPAVGKRVWHVSYHRFCYRDYGRQTSTFCVMETPVSIAFNHQTVPDLNGKRQTISHYTLSFRGGRVAFYRRLGKVVQHAKPFNLDLLAPIAEAYPLATARFSTRVVKLIRAKARANGVKLPAGPNDDVPGLIAAAIWPALSAVQAQHMTLRKAPLVPANVDKWMLRHMRCPPAAIVKSVTGYDSRVITRLFWEALREPVITAGPDGKPMIVDSNTKLWRAKWNWLALLRTWLPLDHGQALLRAAKVTEWDQSFTADPRAARRMLKQWEPKAVLRMLTDTAVSCTTIRDTVTMLSQHRNRVSQVAVPCVEPIPRTRHVQELHDWLTAARNRAHERERDERAAARLAAMTPEDRAAEEERRAAENTPFKHSEVLAALDGRTVVTASDGKVHTIVVPTTPDQLQIWGREMSNCIGGYGFYIRKGLCQILGVSTAGSGRAIDWGIEIADSQIRQFRGRFNADAPGDLVSAVYSVLLEVGLVSFVGYTAVAMPLEAGQLVGLQNVDGDLVAVAAA